MLIPLRRTPMPFKRQVQILITGALLMTGLEVVNLLTGRALNAFGIIPRYAPSLWHLPLAPLLHGNIWHLLGNLSTLILFTLLLFQHGTQRFWLVTWGVILLGGSGVWLFARPAVHLGASLLIFGYFGYLVLAGLISREIRLLLITVLVAMFYGGLIWGVMPQQPWVSYESHLAGLLAGLLLAILFGRARR